MSTIKVKYIGKKPFCIDNVARSGKTWNGPDDVQEVTPKQAQMLVAYKDQWALVDDVDLVEISAPQSIRLKDSDGKVQEITEEELSKPVEKMSCAELVAYAKVKFGKTYKAQMGRKRLQDEVEQLARSMDQIA